MSIATNCSPSLSSAQYQYLCQALRWIQDELQADAAADAATIDNHLILGIARMRIWIESGGPLNVDYKRLSRGSLLALRCDPAVQPSAKRWIDILLKVRSLEEVAYGAFRDDAGAGELGATDET